ncbi:MAG: tRNA uracil 4-sulfurtransferase ThiI [Actinomycetota bacterium]
MTVRPHAIVHYHEIGLKGRNRSMFENILVRNMTTALTGAGTGKPRKLPGRILVPLEADADPALVAERLTRVFGIANVGLGVGGKIDADALKDVAWDVVRDRDYATFAVRARKAHSDFPLSAREINEKVGAHLLERSGKRVNLSEPDLTCYIEIVGDLVVVYADRVRGAGGLPVGSSGKVVALVSSGIDSPVAAARIMRRGSRVVFVHFHSQPFTDASSERQTAEIVEILTRYQYTSSLYVVPLAPSQQLIAASAPESLRTLLYRRMMMRIATDIGNRESAGALVTGDSLGQVASQTLENLGVVEDAAGLPVLRPLVGRDKEEIVAEATMLGTFTVSSAPCQEACVLFEPKRPATKATIPQARAAEDGLDLDALVAEAAKASEVRTFRFP